MFRCSGKTCTDSPYRLIGDNNVLYLLSSNVPKIEFDLTSDDFFCDVALTLPFEFADANDRLKTCLEGCKSSLVYSLVCLAEILTSL